MTFVMIKVEVKGDRELDSSVVGMFYFFFCRGINASDVIAFLSFPHELVADKSH